MLKIIKRCLMAIVEYFDLYASVCSDTVKYNCEGMDLYEYY